MSSMASLGGSGGSAKGSFAGSAASPLPQPEPEQPERQIPTASAHKSGMPQQQPATPKARQPAAASKKKSSPAKFEREGNTSFDGKMVVDLEAFVLGLDSDFAHAAFGHLAEAVKRLSMDHDRLVTKLQKENQDLCHQLYSCTGIKPDPGSPTIIDADTGNQATAHSTWTTAAGGSSDDGTLATYNGETLMERTWNADSSADGTVDANQQNIEADVNGSAANDAAAAAMVEDAELALAENKIEVVVEDTGPESFKDYWKHRIGRSLKSGKFDSIVGLVIVANTLVMSLQLEYSGRVFKDEVLDACKICDVRSKSIERFFDAMEHIFTGIFALELIMRVFIERCRYLRSISNILDGVVVLVSMADSWVLGPLGSDVMGSVAVLRLMRLMRLAKVLRVVRVMKAFRSLRVLVSAVVNSVGALGWSMTLLFVLELVGAIFMAQVIQPFMEEKADDTELQDFIWKHFGTWTNSMFTIFEVTMAPGGFIQYRRLYEEVHPAFGMFFVVYVCVVTFAVVRVITAMFLKATLSASDSDEQDTAREKSEKWSNYVRSLSATADADGSGTLNFEELQDLLKINHFAEWVQEVGLARHEVIRVFSALDQGNDEVVWTEFEQAVGQMRGQPRAADMVINLYETRSILNRVIRMEQKQLAETAAVESGDP